MIQKFILFMVLAVAAYKDIKEQKVYVYLLYIAAVLGVFCHIWYQVPAVPDMIGGMAVGLILLLITWASRGNVGMGDGLMVMVSGIFLGFQKNAALLMTALGLSGLAALFLITIKRKEKNYRIPFLPFLFAAYLVLPL